MQPEQQASVCLVCLRKPAFSEPRICVDCACRAAGLVIARSKQLQRIWKVVQPANPTPVVRAWDPESDQWLPIVVLDADAQLRVARKYLETKTLAAIELIAPVVVVETPQRAAAIRLLFGRETLRDDGFEHLRSVLFPA
jgi:hypothetical protein